MHQAGKSFGDASTIWKDARTSLEGRFLIADQKYSNTSLR